MAFVLIVCENDCLGTADLLIKTRAAELGVDGGYGGRILRSCSIFTGIWGRCSRSQSDARRGEPGILHGIHSQSCAKISSCRCFLLQFGADLRHFFSNYLH